MKVNEREGKIMVSQHAWLYLFGPTPGFKGRTIVRSGFLFQQNHFYSLYI